MKKFATKLLLLFSTFLVGVTAYYVYFFSSASVEEAKFTLKIPDIESEQVFHIIEEKPKEPNFYSISPCDEVNPFKQYQARAKGTVSGGVINYRVVCGDTPESFQNVSNLSGTVIVSVLIDQFGEVENALIMKGHRLLDKSVLSSVRKMRFSPFMLGGEPVKVRGVLIYEFDKDGKVELQKMKQPF